MIGNQEGTQEDYGFAFRQAIFHPRIFVFLGVGVLLFVLVTYWSVIRPYLTYPGAVPLAVGLVTVLASYQLLQWNDNDAGGNTKLSALSSAVAATSGLSWVATTFFGWLHWTAFIVVAVLGAVAVVRQSAGLSWVTGAIAVLAGIMAFVAHHQVDLRIGKPDHSLG